MATNCCNDNWINFNSHENQCFDDEEEALSLCDLPTDDQKIEENSKKEEDDQQDFEFGSYHGVAATSSSENMCSAEEVFFQGQILPLRHSVSSDTGRKINRSASMSIVSSRNNKNGYGYDYRYGYGYKQKPMIRNQFHSHPSPSPQIRTQSFRNTSHSNHKTLWSFLQVGLLKPQEVGLSDLKNRSKRFGSHNSNSSSTSSSINSTIDQNQNQNQIQNQKIRKNTKKKQRFFGGCKCSADSIESTIKETNSKKKTQTTNLQGSSESKMIGEGKQAASRHRTFEWLKQLSIEA